MYFPKNFQYTPMNRVHIWNSQMTHTPTISSLPEKWPELSTIDWTELQEEYKQWLKERTPKIFEQEYLCTFDLAGENKNV